MKFGHPQGRHQRESCPTLNHTLQNSSVVFPLDPPERRLHCRHPTYEFMKVCSITKARPTKGSIIHRRGLAKKKGGIGQHVTKVVSRMFTPNLKTRRLWVTELNRFVTVKLTARALKTVTKNGAYATLKKAGVV